MDRTIFVHSRRDWGAAPPRGPVGGVSEPVTQAFLHCTVSTPILPSASKDEERARMRALQATAFGRGFYDISYSHVVFPSGRKYEGRGWDKAGAHTAGYNSIAYAVAAYIPCAGEPVTPAMLEGMGLILRQGIRNGSIARDYRLRGHREVAAKSCPGDPVYREKEYIRDLSRRV